MHRKDLKQKLKYDDKYGSDNIPRRIHARTILRRVVGFTPKVKVKAIK
jgi:hypothetical protein